MTTILRVLEGAVALFPHADLRFVAAALAVDVAILMVMAWRWRVLLAALGVRTELREMLLVNTAGNAVTNLTPARSVGGDAFRIAAIHARSGASRRVATASVVYDRLADLSGLSVLLILAAPRLSWLMRPSIAVSLAAAVLALAALVPFRRFLAAAWKRGHDKLVGVPLARRSAATAMVRSMGVWMLDALRVMLVGAAFHANITLPMAATLSLARLVSGAAPVPAGIGVVDGALVATLLWGGLSPEVAAAVTLLERSIVYGWATLLGLAALTWLGGHQLLVRIRTAFRVPTT